MLNLATNWPGLAEKFRAKERLPLWKWAENEIVFQKPYTARAEGPYKSEMTPYMREPMEKIQARSIREVIFMGCSQSAKSENLLLMPMRHAVVEEPKTVLYVSSEIEAAEQFTTERIKPGLQLSKKLRKRYKQARSIEHAIYYPDMMIISGWASNSGIFKQRPVALGLADEVSVWAPGTLDKFRKRLSSVPLSYYPTLVVASAMDPKKKKAQCDDIIWNEILNTDQRRYFLQEPEQRNKKTAKRFQLLQGWKNKKSGKESPFGLKWDPAAKLANGKWDIDLVRESAYYLTPGGTKMNESMRFELLQDGIWQPTVEAKDKTKVGYILPVFYVPWEPFGDIAARFINALYKGKESMRVYILEDICEEFNDSVSSVSETVVEERQSEYDKGTRMSFSEGVCNDAGDTFKNFYIAARKVVIVSIDVQQKHLWWLAREWIKGGDSGLIDWELIIDWKQAHELSRKHKAWKTFVDSGYGERTQEVYEICSRYNMVATKGQDNIKDFMFSSSKINPFEGKRRQKEGRVIDFIQFKTDFFKTQLMSRIKGETDKSWRVYNGIENDYCMQVTAEEKRDGKWKEKKEAAIFGNHMLDLEVIQLVAATRAGYNQFSEYEK